MSLPEIEKLDLSHSQTVADTLREAAGQLPGMPEIASMLTIGADNIETLCDALKAQETTIIALRDGIAQLGKDMGL